MALWRAVSGRAGECLQYLGPYSRRLTQRHTGFLPSFRVQMTRRYIEPHSPQTSRSERAYLLQYFPRGLLAFFWDAFFLLARRVSSSWALRKSSRPMMGGWSSVM